MAISHPPTTAKTEHVSRSAALPAGRPYSRLAGLGPFRRDLDLADELAKLVPAVEREAAPPRPAPRVLLRTSLGEIEIELDPERAPQTVARFLKSVTSGQYDGSIFHQVVPGYIVLGGGFRADLSEIPATAPIPNEANHGQRNRLGTVAMARPLDAVHSATGQFFFNLADNPMLDHRGGSAESFGYTVFGQVVEGLDVLQQIADVETQDTERFEFLPVEPVVIETAELIPVATEPVARPSSGADTPRTGPREARR